MPAKTINVPKLTRRTVVASTAVAAGSVASIGRTTAAVKLPRTIRSRRTADRQASPTLVVAFKSDDAQKVRPLLDDYTRLTKVGFDVKQSPYDAFFADLNLNLTGHTGLYDVVSMDDPWVPQFAGGEFIRPLDGMLSERGATIDDFVPELLALGDFPSGSGIRGIPWVGNVQVFAWRTDVLDELGFGRPVTWDDVVLAAQAITEAKQSSGLYAFGLRGVPGNSATTSFLPVLRGYGTDIFANGNWEPQLTSDLAVQAMSTHVALAELSPDGVDVTDHEKNGRNMASGRIAMSADIWPDLLLPIFDPVVSQVAGNVAIGVEPAQEGVAPLTMTGSWLLGIPAASTRAEAAVDFVLWFTAPEQQKRLLLEQQIPATRISVLNDPEAVEQFSFLPGLLAASRRAKPRPRTALYPLVEQILGLHVAQAVAGKIDGQQALINSNDEIRALMEREGQLK